MTLEEVQALTPEQLADIRYKGKTDLFYLCTEILGYDFTEEVHKPVCDFFVKKNPDVEIEDLDVIKDRLLEDPREHYKTTENVGDIVQWIICYPNIRLCLFSGEETLAKQIMTMARNHFKFNEVFKYIYLEHAVDPKEKENVFEFTTPARDNWRLREPTLSITTIKSVSTGGHFNVIKYDDVVTPQNSETKEQLAATIERVRQTHPLLIVGGYRDFIGTRYDFSDVYGWIHDNADETWKVFTREAYSPSVDGEGNPLPPTEESTVLFTVNRAGKKAFDYKELLKRYKEMGPRMFGCQYLNNPQWGESSIFTEKMLRDQCVPLSYMPLIVVDHMSGQTYRNVSAFICWDLAFSEKKAADYTVGIVGAFDNKSNLYLLDMVRGQMGADELINQFFYIYRKWWRYMGRISIEENAGSALIGPSLRARAREYNMGLPIDWMPVARNTTKNERIFGLLPLLKQKKLWINQDMPELEQLIKEFVRFPRYRYDDIPDACEDLLQYQKSVEVQLPPHMMPQARMPVLDLSRRRTDSPLSYGVVG